MSDVAKVFWGSIVRHLLSILATTLVAHGYVTQQGVSAYTEELVGIVLNAAVIGWAQRAHYWEQIKKLVGRSMPLASTEIQVTSKVDELTTANSLPSVFTPATIIPSLVK